jgi:hypothetical protein
VALDLTFPQGTPPQDWWERQIRHTRAFKPPKIAAERTG